MEYGESQGGEGERRGLWERLKESPRTVSTIIIILVIAAAIWAFSERKPQQPTPEATPPAETPTPEAAEPPPEEATPTPAAPETPAEATPPATPAPKVALPEASEDEEAYTEVAQAGDGITHLARRAMERELERQKPDFEVTAEHKVFIEDYIQNRVGRERLKLGETRRIKKELVREAINAARNLTDAQLQNLKQYSRRVAAYQKG